MAHGEESYTREWEEALCVIELGAIDPNGGGGGGGGGGGDSGGDDEQPGGDPPRLYCSDLKGPGTAFTRSLGDGGAEEIGCYADAEVTSRVLREVDQVQTHIAYDTEPEPREGLAGRVAMWLCVLPADVRPGCLCPWPRS